MFVGPILTVPQLYNIWILRDTTGVSMFTWLFFTIGSGIWTWYGIEHKEKPIILSSGLLVIAQGLIVIGTILY